jgi:hypothetical protein
VLPLDGQRALVVSWSPAAGIARDLTGRDQRRSWRRRRRWGRWMRPRLWAPLLLYCGVPDERVPSEVQLPAPRPERAPPRAPEEIADAERRARFADLVARADLPREWQDEAFGEANPAAWLALAQMGIRLVILAYQLTGLPVPPEEKLVQDAVALLREAEAAWRRGDPALQVI